MERSNELFRLFDDCSLTGSLVSPLNGCSLTGSPVLPTDCSLTGSVSSIDSCSLTGSPVSSNDSCSLIGSPVSSSAALLPEQLSSTSHSLTGLTSLPSSHLLLIETMFDDAMKYVPTAVEPPGHRLILDFDSRLWDLYHYFTTASREDLPSNIRSSLPTLSVWEFYRRGYCVDPFMGAIPQTGANDPGTMRISQWVKHLLAPLINLSNLLIGIRIAALSGSAYLLYRSAKDKNWLGIIAALTNIGVHVYDLCVSYDVPVDQTAVKEAVFKASNVASESFMSPSENGFLLHDPLSSVRNLYGAQAQDSSTVPASTGKRIGLSVKLVTCLTSVFGPLIGLKPDQYISHFNQSMAASKNLNDFANDFMLEFFGFDLLGTDDIINNLTKMEAEGNRIMAIPPSLYNFTRNEEARVWLKGAELMLKTIKTRDMNTVVLADCHRLVTGRITDFDSMYSDISMRPIPAALYFFGERGHGKSEYVENYFFPSLSKAFNLSSKDSSVYDMNSGKYARVMAGEPFAKYDEWGATRSNDASIDGAAINSIISGGMCTLPGARLESKHQTVRFAAVALMSNYTINNVHTGLQAGSKEAFISRFVQLKVVDPNYDSSAVRNNQPHRRPDFSHLKFGIPKDFSLPSGITPIPVANLPRGKSLTWLQDKGAYDWLEASDVVKLCIATIDQNQKNWKKMSTARQSLPTQTTNFKLWEPTLPQSGENPIVQLISGPPGTGKTTYLVPQIKSACFACGYNVKLLSGTDGFAEVSISSTPTVYILDDVLDPTTYQGQSVYKAFYDRLSGADLIIIISNFFPISARFAPWGASGIRHANVNLVPGFRRRIGYGTPQHFEYSGDTLRTYKTLLSYKSLSVADYLEKIIEIALGVNFKIIEELPPDDVTWDVTLVLPTDSPTVAEITSNIGLGVNSINYMKHLSPVHRIMSQNENLRVLVRKVGRYILCNCPEIKLKISTPSKVYAIANQMFYSTAHFRPTVSFSDDFLLVKQANTEWKVPVDEFKRYACQNADPSVVPYLMPLELVRGEETLWKQALVRYPLSEHYAGWFTGFLGSAMSKIWSWMRAHPVILIFLVVCVAIVFWILRKTRRDCVCKTMELQDWETEDCPFDIVFTPSATWHKWDDDQDLPTYALPKEIIPAEPQAKGKNKGSRSRFTHFKKIKVNGVWMYEDEADTQLDERVWHGLKALSRTGARSGKVSLGGDIYADSNWDEIGMFWDIQISPVAQAGVRESHLLQNIRKYATKVVATGTIRQEFTHGTFLNNNIIMIPRHFLLNDGPYHSDCGKFQFVPFYEDKAREIAAMYVTSGDKERPFPGVKKMDKHIPTIDIIRSIDTATSVVYRGEAVNLHTHRYRFDERPAGWYCSTFENWDMNAGMVSWGCNEEFTQAGDCGMPVFGHYGDDFFIIGMHAATVPLQQKFASVTLCAEVVKDIHAAYKTRPTQQAQPQTSSVPFNQNYILPDIIKKDFKDEATASYVPTPGSGVSFLSFIYNPKKMDSKGKKQCIDAFKATTQSFKKKVPALTEDEILKLHADKVPFDFAGHQHVHLIKSLPLENNRYSSDMEEMLTPTALALGDQLRSMLGIKELHALSVDDAIKGNFFLLPMPLDTSAGTCMLRMFSAHIKRDLFVDGEKVMLPEVAALVDKQYDLARRRTRLSLPADACLKAENLLVGKEWKKRVFYNVPFPTVLNLKRIFGPVQGKFQKLGTRSPVLLSMYPLHDWDQISSHLQELSQEWVSLDVSNYDHTLPGAVIIALRHVFNELYETSDKCFFRNAIHTFLEEIAFMHIYYNQTLCAKEGGMPSGCWGTSLLDALAWLLMLAFIWTKLTATDVHAFFENVIVKLVGDDLIMAVSSQYREVFHGISISENMRLIFNMDVTPAMNKADQLDTKFLPMFDASFCSNQFVTVPNHPSMIMPKLKEEALSSMLQWSSSSNIQERYNCFLEARLFISPYGKKKFDSFERDLAAFADENRIPHIPKTFKQIIGDVITIIQSDNDDSKVNLERLILHAKRNELPTLMSQQSVKLFKYAMHESLARCNSYTDFFNMVNSTRHHYRLTLLEDGDMIHWPDLLFPKKHPITGQMLKFPARHNVGAFAVIFGLSPPHDFWDCVEQWEHEELLPNTSRNNISFNTSLNLCKALLIHRNADANTPFDHWPHILELASHPSTLLQSDFGALPQSSSAPPSSMGAGGTEGEGGNIQGGGTVTGQLDPLSVPSLTMTPAVATASQEVADSDGASAPTILETIGGLEATGLLNLNYSANIVALMNKDIYVKRYNLASETSAGTILDEAIFNPWDSTLVSKPIAQYGSLHEIFHGSIDITLNSYASSLIIGSIIVSYVPPLLQKNFSPTLENLKTVPSTVLNLKIGGSCKITLTGGNLKDCAVSREEIEAGTGLYGKFYVAAYTDIVNSFDVSVALPIVRLCSLGSDAYFSHPSYLIGRDNGGGTSPTLGPTPPISDNFILDGNSKHALLDASSEKYYDINNGSTDNLEPMPLSKIDSNDILLRGSDYGVVADTSPTQYYYRGFLNGWLGFWWGANEWGNSLSQINSNVERPTTNTSLDGFSISQGEENKGWGALTGNLGSDYTAVDGRFPGPLAKYNDAKPVLWDYTGLSITSTGTADGTGKAHEMEPIQSDSQVAESLIVPHYPSRTLEASTLKVYEENGVRQWNPHGFKEHVRYEFEFVNPPTDPDLILTTSSGHVSSSVDPVYCGINLCSVPLSSAERTLLVSVAGAPLCVTAPDPDSAPAGYISFYFDNDSDFIPLVDPSVTVSNSMPVPASHTNFMRGVRSWLAFTGASAGIQSYSYDLADSSGSPIATVLMNDDGVWAYEADDQGTTYGLRINSETAQFLNGQSYTSKFPSIPAYNSSSFSTRVSSNPVAAYKPVFGKPTNTLKRHEDVSAALEIKVAALTKRLDELATRPQSGYVIGGAMSGLGSGISGLARMNNELKMQKRDLATSLLITRMQLKNQQYLADLRLDAEWARMGYDNTQKMGGNATGTHTSEPSTSKKKRYGQYSQDQADYHRASAPTYVDASTQTPGTSSGTQTGPVRPPRRKMKGTQTGVPTTDSSTQVAPTRPPRRKQTGVQAGVSTRDTASGPDPNLPIYTSTTIPF